jgi:hypothetical protein
VPAGGNQAFTVNQGGSQTFTIAASTDYQLSDVTVDGASQGAVATYTFNAVQMNHTISATFASTLGPANDNFANAQVLTTASGTVNGTTVNATKETGEPSFITVGGKSIWYSLTATASGTLQIDTIGSSFDTVLAVYTGTAVDALTFVASDDQSGGNNTSLLQFMATAGTTYQIVIDGWNPQAQVAPSGTTVLDWGPAPCVSHTYSEFSACVNGTETRTLLTSTPEGCSGGDPQILSQTCATCTSIVYSDFGACQPTNLQYRTIVAASPLGCVGGGITPALTQACTYVAPVTGRDYTTFDGTSLTTGSTLVPARLPLGVGILERRRVKPFSALVTEFPRVLGTTPDTLIAPNTPFAYASPPDRWFEEPTSSAVEIAKSYTIAYDGCLTYTATAAQYGVAPTTTSAATECAAMARRFWSRAASADEIAACVTAATTDTASVTDATIDNVLVPAARIQWAYACAAVVTSTGFLTY